MQCVYLLKTCNFSNTNLQPASQEAVELESTKTYSTADRRANQNVYNDATLEFR